MLLGSEILKAFLLRLGMRQGCQLSPLSSHVVLTVLARQINKRHMVLKGRSKKLSLFSDDMIVYVGGKKNHREFSALTEFMGYQFTRQESVVECKLKSPSRTATYPSALLKWTEMSMQMLAFIGSSGKFHIMLWDCNFV